MSHNFSSTENLLRKPLLNYSDTQERATLVDLDNSDDSQDSMPPRRRRSKRRKSSRFRRIKGAKGVRVTKGRISLKVAGYSGTHKFGASELVRLIPLNKLKAAAKKVLKKHGKKTTKKGRKKAGRKRGRKRGRKGRRRRN